MMRGEKKKTLHKNRREGGLTLPWQSYFYAMEIYYSSRIGDSVNMRMGRGMKRERGREGTFSMGKKIEGEGRNNF